MLQCISWRCTLIAYHHMWRNVIDTNYGYAQHTATHTQLQKVHTAQHTATHRNTHNDMLFIMSLISSVDIYVCVLQCVVVCCSVSTLRFECIPWRCNLFNCIPWHACHNIIDTYCRYICVCISECCSVLQCVPGYALFSASGISYVIEAYRINCA